MITVQVGTFCGVKIRQPTDEEMAHAAQHGTPVVLATMPPGSRIVEYGGDLWIVPAAKEQAQMSDRQSTRWAAPAGHYRAGDIVTLEVSLSFWELVRKRLRERKWNVARTKLIGYRMGPAGSVSYPLP